MLADKGELEPSLSIAKKILVNWLRQIEGGLPKEIGENWEQCAVVTKDIGWVDITPTNITDHEGVNRDLKDWPSFAKDGIDRARQLAWEKAAKSITNYKGVEGGEDEFTTRKLYNHLAQKQPMNAGALHTIITDGVWYPERANKRWKNEDGLRLI
eukprot:943620-Heterocapsa_arctica.AAC.1